jgi:hypothetical protein
MRTITETGMDIIITLERFFASWPRLSRPPTSFLLHVCKDVDARHKAGHDD